MDLEPLSAQQMAVHLPEKPIVFNDKNSFHAASPAFVDPPCVRLHSRKFIISE
jgi:hypothetical protein